MIEKVADVGLGFGQVRYRPEIPDKPATDGGSTKVANVTVNLINAEKPGRPAHYEVDFQLDCKLNEGPIGFGNHFYWKVVLLGLPPDAPYSTIEAQAARQIAPMLRHVAQRIEEAVLKYDEKLANSQESVPAQQSLDVP